MPLTDWQFWIVTAAALAALWIVARMVVKPWRKAQRSSRTKTSLTIEGEKPRK